MTELFTALALALVIEGALYALFPQAMQRFIRQVMEAPPGSLRIAGAVAVVAGLGVIWFLRQ